MAGDYSHAETSTLLTVPGFRVGSADVAALAVGCQMWKRETSCLVTHPSLSVVSKNVGLQEAIAWGTDSAS